MINAALTLTFFINIQMLAWICPTPWRAWETTAAVPIAPVAQPKQLLFKDPCAAIAGLSPAYSFVWACSLSALRKSYLETVATGGGQCWVVPQASRA